MKQFLLLMLLKSLVSFSQSEVDSTFSSMSYSGKWLTIGGTYEFLESYPGLVLSNGFDEKPIIHFEDLTSKFLYKIAGQTDFQNDYSYSGNLSWNYPIRGIQSISFGYSKFDIKSIEFYHNDLGLTLNRYFAFLKSSVNAKFGYQELNREKNLGVEIGLQRSHYLAKVYYGLTAGYYSDYFTYKIYCQKFIFNRRISLRLVYQNIDSIDFLNLGLHYSFLR